MSYFDQVYQRIFQKGKVKNEILTFESIKRNDPYRSAYFSWVCSDLPQQFLKQVADSYSLKLHDRIGDPDVHIFNSSQSNGFAISFNDRLDQQKFQFFFDWLAERVEAMGYKRSNSDLKISSKADFVESVEKHYLKPKQQDDGGLFDQEFGNILIEYIRIDDRPSYIKLVANTYSDRSYKEAASFDRLLEHLFTFG